MEEKKPLKSFPVPEAVEADPTGAAVVAAWIVKGHLQVAAQRSFEKPEMWGMLLMDLARHASRVYAQQGVMSEQEALARISGVLSRQLGGGADSGTTTFI